VRVIKTFKTYEEQIEILRSRGMLIGDVGTAIDQLRRVNYYRLSGYWYPFRKIQASADERRSDEFYQGTTLDAVLRLYAFDARLRAATFTALAPIELRVRALLGHGLGRVDERAHLRPERLNARATTRTYAKWLADYESRVANSHEEFVDHHKRQYGGALPVWVAVEILDWGGLVRLYGFSPRSVQDDVADAFGLRAPQLESWLRTLNVLRNICAHHGRLFNRVHALIPKLPRPGRYPDLDHAGSYTRTFGQLTLIQFLLRSGGERIGLLPAVVRTYPHVPIVPLGHLGASPHWADNALWRT